MTSADDALLFLAGPSALAHVRERGLNAADIRVVVGASGGPKWLVLSQLDCALIDTGLLRAQRVTHLLGSSIGAWRMICHAQPDPRAAIERFEKAYVGQTYSARPDRAEITAKSREILAGVLGATGAADILSAPWHRVSIMTVRARGPAASERRAVLGSALGAAALANAVSRRSLGIFFERALFYDERDRPPFADIDDLPIQRVALSPENLGEAVLASGSIPMVLDGIRDIPGARPGVYRDGGVTDYHFDTRFWSGDGLVLYPHFYPYLVPGWFDKRLARRAAPASTDNVLVICPSPQFVATLPNGKIPDRNDFVAMNEGDRIAAWNGVIDRCRVLADTLREAVATGRIAAMVRPLG